MKKFILKIRIQIVTKSVYIWESTKSIGNAFKREARETKDASKILMRIMEGKEVSHEEIKFLKSQSADLGKALAIIGLQAVPGSSIAIIAIEKVVQRHGFTLFPKDQEEAWLEKKSEPEHDRHSETQSHSDKTIR